MNYLLHLITIVGIFSVLAISLDLLIGYCGLFSLCQAAVYGVGAYVSAILLNRYGCGFGVSWGAALIAGTFAGVTLSVLASRMRGDAFTLMTLAFQVMATGVAQNATSHTGGAYGITNVPGLPDHFLGRTGTYACVALVAVTLSIGLLWRIRSSQFGRSLRAIRDDELAAAGLGKPVFRMRMTAAGLSGAMAALAGAIYASYVGFIDSSSFGLAESFVILTMVVLGGPCSLRGPLVGAGAVLLIPELLRAVHVGNAAAANLQQITFGLLLIIAMYARPQGLFGAYRIK